MKSFRRVCLGLAPCLLLAVGPGGVFAAPEDSSGDTVVLLSETQGVGLEPVVHPSGVELALERASTESDSIVVKVKFRNRSFRPVEMNGRSDMFLRDNLGHTYRLVIPRADPKLRLGPESVLDTELTFLGPLTPEANTVTLIINDGAEPDPVNSVTPKFVVGNIPIRQSNR